MKAPQETRLVAGLSRDGARHRDADRAARLPCGVVDRGGEAGALGGDRGDRGRDDRRGQQSAAGPPQQERRQQIGVSRVGPGAGRQREPGRGDQQPRHRGQPRAEPAGDAPADVRRRPSPRGVPPSPPTSVPRSEPMAGRATLTTVTSSSTRKYPVHITTRTARGDPEFPGRTARRSSVTGAAARFPSYQAALTAPGAREPYGETIRGGRRCSVTSVRRPSATVAVM